jgi:NitT/TauT family transport system ATP-binding protein
VSWSSTQIELQGIAKRFRRKGTTIVACQDINLTIKRGEFVAIVGPSGCGKSTLLSMIAGLMRPSAGIIRYGGTALDGINRNVGFVTQRDNLLPWKTVEDNVGIALEIAHVQRDERRRRVQEYIELVGLTGFNKHYPAELSGGMRKRVGLARTLIYDPETILMDEPFGALDAQLKLVLQDEVLKLWERSKKTIVFVTHDLGEAVALSDRVVALSRRPGRVRLIEEIDLPRPRDVFRVRFTERFSQLHESLWQALEQDVRQAVEA